jgi:hypothetical protein
MQSNHQFTPISQWNNKDSATHNTTSNIVLADFNRPMSIFRILLLVKVRDDDGEFLELHPDHVLMKPLVKLEHPFGSRKPEALIIIACADNHP